jgi:muramoyltetrapeptide carboxypeptidase
MLQNFPSSTPLHAPPFLQKGDSIRLIAPSGIVEPIHIEQAVSWIEENGFVAQVGIHMTDNFFRFSATDEHRLSDLQKALDSQKIKAIWCVRGGYGMTRILDKINWTKFIENPKWLIGFSDITAIHLKINQLGFQGMHGFMPVQFKYLQQKQTDLEKQVKSNFLEDENSKNIEKTIQNFLDAITGKSYQISSTFNKNNKLGETHGKIKGEIIGGNLSMIINSLSTPTEINTDNKILFLEEVGENLYAVDRMLGQLYRAGKLKNLKGLVIGSFSDSKQTVEQFGFSVEQIILDLTKEYTYPIAFDFPIGHTSQNETVICGATVIFEVNNKGGVLKFLQNSI